MDTKKYLKLSSQQISELENRYHYIANKYEITETAASLNRDCLNETMKIARLRKDHKFHILKAAEKRLFEKRQFAVCGKLQESETD